MKYNGKFSATWVYDDGEDAYYLVPASVADIFKPNDEYPVIASVSGDSLWKRVNVLGATAWEFAVLELGHREGEFVRAKAEVTEALRQWGIEVEDVDR